jgi:hypothetical protein
MGRRKIEIQPITVGALFSSFNFHSVNSVCYSRLHWHLQPHLLQLPTPTVASTALPYDFCYT